MSSLEILNGHQSTQLLLKMWTLRITWVRYQSFHGLCQRSHHLLRPPDSTGRGTSSATFLMTVCCLFLMSVICKMEVGISCIYPAPSPAPYPTPNDEGSFDVATFVMDHGNPLHKAGLLSWKSCTALYFPFLQLCSKALLYKYPFIFVEFDWA